jgi:hypothetical protein
MAAVLAAGALLCGWTAPAKAAADVFVAITPPETTLEELAALPHMSVGVMSAGIGEVPPEQTYLDISQGNRIDDTLYERPLPPLQSFDARVPNWAEIVRRANDAPADVVPGLLASTLLSSGIRSEAVPAAESAALLVAERDGVVGREVRGRVRVFASGVGVVRKLAPSLRGNSLVIAIADPTSGDETVPIGIAGSGFEGNLTSDSTRTDGYVLSTDIAPTILRRFGLSIPGEMDGEPIRSEGSVDALGVENLAARMATIPDRREPILVICLLAWSSIAFAVNRIVFGLLRVAMAWLALCFAFMPLMLLTGAWLEPSGVAEGLLVGFGAAALAALTVRFAWGWRGLAIACAITVVAYGIDVIAGSGLTRLSLLGPNPIFGARFYGIGNELEALFAVMVPVAVGAGLTAAGKRWPITPGRAVGAFLVAGGLAAVVFAAGRFGADIGAAIVLPLGAAVAAASLGVGSRRRFAVAVIGVPLIALLFLALIDLISGANAHLTRSVFDAGGAGDLADLAERRLRLSAHDFAQAAGNPLFWVVVAAIGVAVAKWRRIDAWLTPAPLARAGFLGACAAVAVGVLVNDSGATFLVLGSIALGATLAYAWSQAPAEGMPASGSNS